MCANHLLDVNVFKHIFISIYVMFQKVFEIAQILQVPGTHVKIAKGIQENHAESVPDQMILRQVICAELVAVVPNLGISDIHSVFTPLIVKLILISIQLSVD